MKKVLAVGWLCLLAALIGGIFWYNDYRYSSPTPIPPGYLHIRNGEYIAVGQQLHFSGNKPLFLHFFNPDCPCSRFNIAHFKSLARQFGTKADFAVILMTDKHAAAQVRSRFRLSMPVIVDPALALRSGVYSTPQAVILDPAHKLYFRGNYNSSRYCVDERTEFARMALVALLKNSQAPLLNAFAFTAYGCSLPNCTK